MKSGNYFTIDDVPQYIFMAISIALSVLIAGLIMEIIENVMRIGTGYVTMIAILSVIPVVVVELLFVFGVIYLYRKWNAAGRLFYRFLLVTGVELFLFGALRWVRITVATVMMGGTREQSLVLAGMESEWLSFALAGAGIVLTIVSVALIAKNPRY